MRVKNYKKLLRVIKHIQVWTYVSITEDEGTRIRLNKTQALNLVKHLDADSKILASFITTKGDESTWFEGGEEYFFKPVMLVN
jgi:hypothetical protein